MKKKFLLLLAATLASASGWATNLEVGETIEYNDLVFRAISTSENEGDVEVVGFEVPGHEQRLIIPGTVTQSDDTFTVVSIVENAFQGTGLSEISIPVTVKTIGKDAFAGIWSQYQSGCKIAYEGSMADWCGIDFANGGSNPLQSAYKDVTKITLKYMYENITFAGNHIFEETVDGSNSFYTFRIPDDVKVIKPYAFYGIGATSVEIPGTVEEIGESAFGEIRLLGTSSYGEMDRVVTFEKGDKPLVLEGKPFSTSRWANEDAPVESPLVKAEVYYGRELSGTSGLDHLAGIVISPDVDTFGDTYQDLGFLESFTVEDSTEPIAFENAPLSGRNTYYDFYLGRDFTGALFTGDQFTYAQIDLTIGGNVTEITPGQFEKFRVFGLNFLYGPYALELVATPFKQDTNLSVSIDRNINGQLGLNNINRSLSFGEHLTVIGDNLFRECIINPISPIDLTIPDNVRKIGNSAFQGCSGISTLTLGSGLTEIGSNAFEGCTGITSVTIPDAVTTLGQSAFSGCTSLATANIGLSVDIVRNDTFNGCTALKQVSMPDGILTIGNNAFNGCTALEQITIPGSVTSVGQNAFNGCKSMRSVIFAEGDAELMLMETPFNGCTLLGNLYLGRNLMSDIKFGLESSLHTLIISDNVKSIGDNAFKDYTSLRNISIGTGLEESGVDAFAGCPVSEVRISDLAKWCAIDFANTNANPTSISRTIYLNNSVVENLEIPDGVEEVKPFVFYNNLAKMVTLGSDVKKIGQSALDNNTELAVVVFNNDLAEIGSYAFKGCVKLQELELKDHVETIGDNAFFGCSAITSMTLPASVKSIGTGAFGGCILLSTTNISDLTAWFGIDFANYDSNPLHIGGELMLGNEMVTRLKIPEGITAVKPYAFYGANAIVSVAAPDGLLTVGDYAFYGNKMLELVDFAEEDARSVGAHAFEACPRLSSIFLGCNVSEIGENAFVGCPALKTVDAYNLTPAEIAKFDDAVYANATLTVPAGSSFDYGKAEGWKEFANIEEGAEVYNITIGWDEAYGTVLYLGEKWEEFNVMQRSVELYIYPDEGYKIGSITVNGNEMLSLYDEQNNLFDLGEIDEDKDIVVYFEDKDGGIGEIGSGDVSVRGASGAILVDGLGHEDTVNVYNTAGQLVYSGNDSVINTVSGVYVIEISGKVYKTVVR